MSFISVQKNDGNGKKIYNILSLQMVCGGHIPLNLKKNIKTIFLMKARQYPDKYIIDSERMFRVYANRQDITYTCSGESKWILVIGYKSVIKKVTMLLIGNKIWGIEMDQGVRLKRAVKSIGVERAITILRNQMISMINCPDRWEKIEITMSRR